MPAQVDSTSHPPKVFPAPKRRRTTSTVQKAVMTAKSRAKNDKLGIPNRMPTNKAGVVTQKTLHATLAHKKADYEARMTANRVKKNLAIKASRKVNSGSKPRQMA